VFALAISVTLAFFVIESIINIVNTRKENDNDIDL